jgi:hypothetical protein
MSDSIEVKCGLCGSVFKGRDYDGVVWMFDNHNAKCHPETPPVKPQVKESK